MERMSELVFIRCAEKTRLQPHTLGMAQDVLVRGLRAKQVADDYGVDPKVVYRACSAIRTHRHDALKPEDVADALARVEEKLDRLLGALQG